MSIKKSDDSTHSKCQKWKEQVKVSNDRRFWIFILKIETLVMVNF
jgi:hypothetical protein